MSTDYCPVYSPFFSVLGVACAMVFTSSLPPVEFPFRTPSFVLTLPRHRSYGTAKSSIGISATSVMRPDLMVRCCIPVVMSGIIAIYGLVVSVVVSDSLTPKMPLFTGVVHLGAGLSVGLSGLAAGFAIGIAGEAGVRGAAVQPRLFVGMASPLIRFMLILIFAEVLGIYGLIVALILNNKGTVKDVDALCPGSFGTGLGAGVVNNQW
ncbi:unnamed protein product [Rhizoctonia solani]|uniref:V-type proton ATPase proteolipid subunit n=1 Tax=Rhizoctonia solani TaxID=456999 RepID=A0A8H3CM12_9AGAM|nr:unnamed protein product [Rhizoctonia solani]